MFSTTTLLLALVQLSALTQGQTLASSEEHVYAPAREVIPLTATPDGFFVVMPLRLSASYAGDASEQVLQVIPSLRYETTLFSSWMCGRDTALTSGMSPATGCYNETKSPYAVHDNNLVKQTLLPTWEVFEFGATKVQDKVSLVTQSLGGYVVPPTAPVEVEQMFLATVVRTLSDFSVYEFMSFNFTDGWVALRPSAEYAPTRAARDFRYDPETGEAYAGDTPALPLFTVDVWADQVPSVVSPRPNHEPRIYLGGIDERYRDSLHWTTFEASGPTFGVYDLEMCGITLSEPEERLRGSLDLMDPCLTLPSDIFFAVVRELPLECSLRFVCNVPADVVHKLPTISFSLSPGGPKLYVSLSELILPPKPGDPLEQQVVCLARDSPEINVPRVVLGVRALTSLEFTLDYATSRLGLANTLHFAPENTQCRVQRQCIGMQVRDEQLNVCLDPACNKYYMFYLDEEERVCRLSISFHISAITFILAYLVAEVGVYEMANKVATAVERNVNSH